MKRVVAATFPFTVKYGDAPVVLGDGVGFGFGVDLLVVDGVGVDTLEPEGEEPPAEVAGDGVAEGDTDEAEGGRPVVNATGTLADGVAAPGTASAAGARRPHPHTAPSVPTRRARIAAAISTVGRSLLHRDKPLMRNTSLRLP